MVWYYEFILENAPLCVRNWMQSKTSSKPVRVRYQTHRALTNCTLEKETIGKNY